MSTMSHTAGTMRPGWTSSANRVSRSSGTDTCPIWASIVQKGKFAACAFALDRQLKRVDFPTLGRPTIPAFNAIAYVFYYSICMLVYPRKVTHLSDIRQAICRFAARARSGGVGMSPEKAVASSGHGARFLRTRAALLPDAGQGADARSPQVRYGAVVVRPVRWLSPSWRSRPRRRRCRRKRSRCGRACLAGLRTCGGGRSAASSR